MAQYKSPRMEARERFIGGSVRERPTGRAGIVGSFEWGPVNSITTITNRTKLAEVFGTPTDKNYNDFFNAYNFLNYANDLRVVRVINKQTARNSTGIYEQLDFDIINGGTSYEVGDSVAVRFDSQVIEDSGKITKVSDSGEILAISMPTRKIIERLKNNGTYPKTTNDWSIKVDESSFGVGAMIEIKGIITDSNMTIVNSDFATDQLRDVKFGEMSLKYGLPRISAIYAGQFGDRIDVEIVSRARFYEEVRGELTIFPYGNKRPMYAKDFSRYGPKNDSQYAVIVYVNGEMRENFIVSTDNKDVDTLSGNSLYMDSFFNLGSSEYIVMSALDFPEGFNGVISLGGGMSSSESITSADYIEGYDIFRYDETVKINTLIAGGVANLDAETATTVQKYAVSIGDTNQNIVVVVDPLAEDVVNKPSARVAVSNVVARRNSKLENNLNINSTYAVFTSNYAQQYDNFNRVKRWVSLSGDMAGLMAQADARATPAQSPAGTEFGVLANKLKLAYNPNQELRDQLTTVSMNPVVSFEEGSGFMFFADLTASYEQSHFDHINNRRVANFLKETFLNMARGIMFKNNTNHTRLQFKSTGEAYLKTLSGNTIEYGRIWCDDKNNTPDVQFRKEFVATIYYKPLNSINYIILNFVSVESDIQIEEDISQVAPF